MPIEIPSWLHAPDVAADYAKGLALGSQVAEASQRLQAENTRTQMEAQARAQSLKREQTMQQQELATKKAYQDAQVGLKKQQLDQIGAMNAAKMKAAAGHIAALHKYGSLVGGGMSHQDALFQVPELATPQNLASAQKTDEDLGSQRLELSRQRLEFQQQQGEARRNKPVEVGEQENTTTDSDTGEKTTTRRKIFGAPGDSAGLQPSKGKITKEQAKEFIKLANGDKEKARKLARDAGYEL